jgi:low temperature requirement protein LtrA
VVTEYLSERFQQFFVVALGELILVAGLTYGGRYFAVRAGHTTAFVVSFTTTVLLWRVYTYRSGESLPAALAAAENQGARVQRALAAHLLMVVGVVLTATGYELVIDHPLGHTPPTWLADELPSPPEGV